MGRRLERHLDLDLIARMEASGRPEKPRRMAKVRAIRHGDTYRGARRNAAGRSFEPLTVNQIEWRTLCPRIIPLNRSAKWTSPPGDYR
jgi:hypothetical protein